MAGKCIIFAAALCLTLSTSASVHAQETMTVRIDSISYAFGDPCYVGGNWLGDSLMDIGYSISENDTVYFLAHQQPGQAPVVETQIITPDSPTIGTGWWFDFGGGGIDYAQVVSHSMITVPLGQFPAFTYEYTDSMTGDYSGYMQFSPNHGIIGLMQMSEEDTTVWGLASFDCHGGSGMFPLAVGNEWIFDLLDPVILPKPEWSPTVFSLLPSHPNPFNPSTVLSFELRAASFVRLEVFNPAGSWITTLAEGWKPAGVHEVFFDGSGLPSGMYLAWLTARDYTAMQKMVLLK